MNSIGIRVKELRKEKGMTQEELAELSKMNLRTIQRIENDETTPRGNSLIAICEALQIDIQTIIPKKSHSGEHKVAKIIAEIVFLISLNITIMAVFGFLTFDTSANLNSMFGAVLLSIFIPLVIVFLTPKLSSVSRVLKFGTGLIAYMILALILHSFPEPTAIMKGLVPSIIIFLAILFYGNTILRRLRD